MIEFVSIREAFVIGIGRINGKFDEECFFNDKHE